jgi:glutaredoxin
MTAVVYSSKTCSPCKMVKQWLTYKGVTYIVKDIEEDNNAEEAVKISGQTIVPIVVINGKVITGYKPAELTAAL